MMCANKGLLMNLSWWLWLLLCLIMFARELMTPGGFFIFFFGVGAIVVGLLTLLGLAGPPSLQWLLFVAISVVAFAIFRKPLQNRLGKTPAQEVDSLVGEVAITLGDI